jgi:hypothetical protein
MAETVKSRSGGADSSRNGGGADARRGSGWDRISAAGGRACLRDRLWSRVAVGIR